MNDAMHDAHEPARSSWPRRATKARHACATTVQRAGHRRRSDRARWRPAEFSNFGDPRTLVAPGRGHHLDDPASPTTIWADGTDGYEPSTGRRWRALRRRRRRPAGGPRPRRRPSRRGPGRDRPGSAGDDIRLGAGRSTPPRPSPAPRTSRSPDHERCRHRHRPRVLRRCLQLGTRRPRRRRSSVGQALSMPKRPPRLRVAIVGGGAAGVLVAAQVRRRRADAQVTVIDASGRPGTGAAYGTPDAGHLLNVPAGRMSAWPDDPDDFCRWLDEHAVATFDGFAPRIAYGRYLGDVLAGADVRAGARRGRGPDAGRAGAPRAGRRPGPGRRRGGAGHRAAARQRCPSRSVGRWRRCSARASRCRSSRIRGRRARSVDSVAAQARSRAGDRLGPHRRRRRPAPARAGRRGHARVAARRAAPPPPVDRAARRAARDRRALADRVDLDALRRPLSAIWSRPRRRDRTGARSSTPFGRTPLGSGAR